jgi:cysteine desulfurase
MGVHAPGFELLVRDGRFEGTVVLEVPGMSGWPIYLDAMATTPLAPESYQAMLPWLDGWVGNPSSSTHRYGWEAADAVEREKAAVATTVGAAPGSRIVFTSGATEANNMVILGLTRADEGRPAHVVSTALEHPSVRAPIRAVASAGTSFTEVSPCADGVIDPEAVAEALRPDTRLISVMAVNNEIGTVQPIEEIAKIAASHGVPFHVDASQAIGKIHLGTAGIDFLSLSAHKLYGPVGVGALCIGPSAPALPPLLHGGGQQLGCRPGTLPVAQIVGFGTACRLVAAEIDSDHDRIAALARFLIERLRSLDGVALNGSAERRVPGCINVAIDGVLAEALIAVTPDVAISAGSACSSGSGSGSPVLRAIGLSPARSACSVRVGISRYTTREEIDEAAALLLAGIGRIREGRVPTAEVV